MQNDHTQRTPSKSSRRLPGPLAHAGPVRATRCVWRYRRRFRERGWNIPIVPGGVGGVTQSTFCMVHRKTMIAMGSPYFVWLNTNEIISSGYLLDAVCVTPPGGVVAGEPPPPGGRTVVDLQRLAALWMSLASEKDAMLAHKLGRLQPVIVVFPRERMGQPASFGPS